MSVLSNPALSAGRKTLRQARLHNKIGGEMQIPEYITKEEVRRICKELKISDWTALSEPIISIEEAKIILTEINTKEMNIHIDDFKQGLEVELEHGLRFDDANVTNNHPIITGKIVLAHMKDSLDYYKLLEVAELEGDLLKAIKSDNMTKVKDKYKKLIQAQVVLKQTVSTRLK